MWAKSRVTLMKLTVHMGSNTLYSIKGYLDVFYHYYYFSYATTLIVCADSTIKYTHIQNSKLNP